MAYDDRAVGMVHPDAELLRTSSIEEDIQQLNELNQAIAEMLNKRNNLMSRVRENNDTINRQISSIQKSQFEFEAAASRLLIDDETVKSDGYERDNR